jgi:hypothetical protein
MSGSPLSLYNGQNLAFTGGPYNNPYGLIQKAGKKTKRTKTNIVKRKGRKMGTRKTTSRNRKSRKI